MGFKDEGEGGGDGRSDGRSSKSYGRRTCTLVMMELRKQNSGDDGVSGNELENVNGFPLSESYKLEMEDL